MFPDAGLFGAALWADSFRANREHLSTFEGLSNVLRTAKDRIWPWLSGKSHDQTQNRNCIGESHNRNQKLKFYRGEEVFPDAGLFGAALWADLMKTIAEPLQTRLAAALFPPDYGEPHLKVPHRSFS